MSPALPAPVGIGGSRPADFGFSALTLLIFLSIVVGLVHNLCEPGFFGDSKFLSLIAGSLQHLGCWLSS